VVELRSNQRGAFQEGLNFLSPKVWLLDCSGVMRWCA
jgi:hypothetical protein